MLAKITWREFVEWQAFFQTDPFGGRRLDLLFALLRSDIHNLVRGKDDDPVRPMELDPGFGKSREERKREEREKMKRVPQKVKEVLSGFG